MAVYVESTSLEARLTRIGGGGLAHAMLRKSVEIGDAKRQSCTKLDAAGHGGMSQYSGTLRSVREELLPFGWRAAREHNLELVISPDDSTAIMVGSGNALTGTKDPGQVPSSRYPRGAVTIVAVLNNNNGQTRFSFDDRILTAGQYGIRRTTWVLLLYSTRTEVRYELSQPMRVSSDGYKIVDWRDRLVFDPIVRDAAPTMQQAEDEDDIEIEVHRRAR